MVLIGVGDKEKIKRLWADNVSGEKKTNNSSRRGRKETVRPS